MEVLAYVAVWVSGVFLGIWGTTWRISWQESNKLKGIPIPTAKVVQLPDRAQSSTILPVEYKGEKSGKVDELLEQWTILNEKYLQCIDIWRDEPESSPKSLIARRQSEKHRREVKRVYKKLLKLNCDPLYQPNTKGLKCR